MENVRTIPGQSAEDVTVHVPDVKVEAQEECATITPQFDDVAHLLSDKPLRKPTRRNSD